jgi:hypothetical protein
LASLVVIWLAHHVQANRYGGFGGVQITKQPAVLNNAGDLTGSYGTSLQSDTDQGFILFAYGGAIHVQRSGEYPHVSEWYQRQP